MKQLIDMRELKQAQQTGCDTTEHNLAASAKGLETSDKRPQATTIDELKRRHIHNNMPVPTLHQVDELGFKLWGRHWFSMMGTVLPFEIITYAI